MRWFRPCSTRKPNLRCLTYRTLFSICANGLAGSRFWGRSPSGRFGNGLSEGRASFAQRVQRLSERHRLPASMTGSWTNTIPASADFPGIFRQDNKLMQALLIRSAHLWLPIGSQLRQAPFYCLMLFLICNLIRRKWNYGKTPDARLVSIGQVRASEIGEFLTERRQAAERLAGSEDIANYFSNLDLGMSVKYPPRSPIWLQLSAAFSRPWTRRNIRGNPPTCGWPSLTTTAWLSLRRWRAERVNTFADG